MRPKIEWVGEARPDLEEGLLADLEATMFGDDFDDEEDDFSGLVFHTWVLTDRMDGPSVWVSWHEERACLVAEYCERSEWVTLDGEPVDIGSGH